MPVLTRHRLAALGAALALGSAAPAAAAPPPEHPNASAVSQYTELVPGAEGPSAPALGGGEQTALSPAARQGFRHTSSEMASALEEIATSSRYGAPTAASPQDDGSAEAAVDPSIRRMLSAIGSTSDARVIALLVALLATTVAAGALSLRRRAAV